MRKMFTKWLIFSAVFTLLVCGRSFGQVLTIGGVDPGPYAPGSSISVPVAVTGTCVNTTTSYNLYLSNASGSFAAEKLIGSFSNFYTTFVNGIIPNGTAPGAGYMVRVKSTNPAVISTLSGPFTVQAGTGVVASISSQVINPTYPVVFGSCNGVAGTSYSFVDQSTTGSTVTASFYNELSGAVEASITPNAAGVSFTAKAAHYTIMVKAVNSGIVGTKSFFLINNAVNTSFGVTGSNTICLSNGNNLSYNVDITSASGIQNNFPGLIYNISWGDGASSQLTLCDILAAGGKLTHAYLKSSCGNNPNGQHNSFEVDFQPSNLYCGKVGTQVTSYAQVITPPQNAFRAPIAACINTPVIFENVSDPGQDPGNTQSSCKSVNALYTWIVDGVTVASNYPINKNFTYTFTTAGTHSVMLHLQNANFLCSASDVTEPVCIQNPPQPKFTLPATAGCFPVTIIPNNQSVIDSNCNATNQYIWNVTGPAPVNYMNGTNASSKIPQFSLTEAGSYKIQLGITTASCGTLYTPWQTVDIDSVSVAKLSADAIVCGTNQTFNFNPNAGPTQTVLSGNAKNTPGTYKWTITGGNFTFKGGSSDTSRYPQVNFTDLATYTVSVINTNLCSAPATATQHLTFAAAPTVSAGKDAAICANVSSPLQGSIIGTINSMQWVGGNGTFTPDRNALKPGYLPSAGEINAGQVTLTLMAVTPLTAPCDTIYSNVTLSITKPDSITSAPVDTVCSGVALNYQVTASVPKSTFTWTIDQANTSASATGYALNGSGTVINDKLVNNDPINYANVTYDVTAVGGTGCASNSFVLTVSIAPKQAIAKFTQDVTSGCDTVKVQFTNVSTPAGGSFAWNFGDGATSTEASPFHSFMPRSDGKDTVYTVTLTMGANCGTPAPALSTVTVSPKIPVAFISPKQIVGCSPFTLAVDNFSPGKNQSYTYYLYDGATLVQQITTTDKSEVRFNPVSVATTTQYTLYMIATGYCGVTGQSNAIPITVSAATIISQMFVENGVSKGCAPFTATFINNSLGADTYYYTIYDVNHTVVDRRQGGTDPLPYVFGTPGTYYVTLTATNSCSMVESGPPLRIDVYKRPLPDFSADVTSGCKNVSVTFSNLTPDDPTTQAASLLYDWDFGDGTPHSFAYLPPPHIYNYRNSPFTVTVRATNSATGCDNSISKAAYINITAPPGTAFTESPDSLTSIPNYRFAFSDATTGSPATWNWTFGDGQTSTSQNPGHTYADTGTYKVTLTTATSSGCDSTIVHHVRITGVPGQLYLPNAFEPTSGTIELQKFTAKGSGIKQWRLQIFNNYSQLIWETTKLSSKGEPVEGWDGTIKGSPAPQGVYVWQASATFINGQEWKGNTIGNSLPKRTGTISLIR